MWKLHELIELLQPKQVLKPDKDTFKNISIDSRTIGKDDVFLAFKGQFRDGHDFIDEAFKKQCAVCICEKDTDKPHLKVEDSKDALKKLATYNKSKNNAKVVSIIGSVGKTSTKELLKSYFNTINTGIFFTQANENNWIGVCKTLLRASSQTQFGVVEVGTNHSGEISEIGRFLNPDFVIFTEIGTSHLGNFGSIESIFEEKVSIVRFLENKNNIIYNKDNPLLRDYFEKVGVSYSKNDASADVCILDYNKSNDSYVISVRAFGELIRLRVPFWLNVSNVLAAVSFFGYQKMLDQHYFQKAIDNTILPHYRMQVERLNNTNFILDCYNASFESVKFAIDELNAKQGKKLAILGDILELGEHSENIHKQIGQYIANFEIDLITYGQFAKYIAFSKEKASFFEDKKALSQTLKSIYCNYDWILIKGSRGLKMEEIFNNVKEA